MAMSLPRLYVETTIPSYLTARPSRDTILAGQQETPRRSRDEHRAGRPAGAVNDPIVEEVRRIRAEIAARNGNDLCRIFKDARSREGSSGRRVVSYEPANTVEPTCVVREEPPKP